MTVTDGFRWTKEHDAELGTMSDDALASRLRLPRAAIVSRRWQLGVPKYVKPTRTRVQDIGARVADTPSSVYLSEEEILAVTVARMLDLVKEGKRNLHVRYCQLECSLVFDGIAAGLRVREILPLMDELHSRALPDGETMPPSGLRNTDSLRKRVQRCKLELTGDAEAKPIVMVHWDHVDVVSRMGVDTDCEIATSLGVRKSTVRAARLERGIAAVGRREANQLRMQEASEFWTPSRDALLGTTNDGEIADALGISRQQVARRRYAMKVPAFKGGGTKWTVAEIEKLQHASSIEELSEQTGRSRSGCVRKIWELKHKGQYRGDINKETNDAEAPQTEQPAGTVDARSSEIARRIQ